MAVLTKTDEVTLWHRRARGAGPIFAGALALGVLLLPASALGMDVSSTPLAKDVRSELVLPPVLYPHRMDWKPTPPLLKIDTLLEPDGSSPARFAVPFEYGRKLAVTS